jgi:cholesterol transport system auxiliary component
MTTRIACWPVSQRAVQPRHPRQPRLSTAGLALAALLLAGCTTPGHDPVALFDLGPLPAPAVSVAANAGPIAGPVVASNAASKPASAAMPGMAWSLPALSIADPNVPTWLDRPAMMYRLAYANDQQPHSYATSRWTSPPVQLFTQRLKASIGQAGGVVLPASDGAVNALLLHIDADDFSQVFSSPARSAANVMLRASVFRERTLLAQKSFAARTAAPTADAQGGVRALGQASDAVIDEMMRWLATVPLQK